MLGHTVKPSFGVRVAQQPAMHSDMHLHMQIHIHCLSQVFHHKVPCALSLIWILGAGANAKARVGIKISAMPGDMHLYAHIDLRHPHGACLCHRFCLLHLHLSCRTALRQPHQTLPMQCVMIIPMCPRSFRQGALSPAECKRAGITLTASMQPGGERTAEVRNCICTSNWSEEIMSLSRRSMDAP